MEHSIYLKITPIASIALIRVTKILQAWVTQDLKLEMEFAVTFIIQHSVDMMEAIAFDKVRKIVIVTFVSHIFST
jgi:hypothetical protein